MGCWEPIRKKKNPSSCMYITVMIITINKLPCIIWLWCMCEIWRVQNKLNSWARCGREQPLNFSRAYPGFCSMKWLGVLLLPLDRMLVHRRVIPWHYICWYPFIYLGGERHCESKVSWPRSESNMISRGRARTWTAQSGGKWLTMRLLCLHSGSIPA